jgi:hypothetical protein
MYLIHGKMSRLNCNYRVELDLMARTNPPCMTPAKVLMNQIHYGRFLIENPADALQFSGLGRIDRRVHEWKLFLALFAHFVVAPFFILIVISIAWTLSIYYQKKRKSTAKCAFFMQFN